MIDEKIYTEYELLLPSKLEGGYLIVTLYDRIKNQELSETFGSEDISLILDELSAKHQLPKQQTERIIKKLLHYCLRNVPDEYGKFTLTEHAKRVVELVQNKLENPYKNFALRQSFEKYFIIRFQEIKTLQDLETKFGRDFTEPYKRIILDHIESLEEEMIASYKHLNTILNTPMKDATSMVKEFVSTFSKFGDRAEDISESIASKDGFVRKLRAKVDEFYEATQLLQHPQTDVEHLKLHQAQKEWRQSLEIYRDLESFFLFIDRKIAQIRKHILKGSHKLTELQENFSSRSDFRLKLKKLFHLSLAIASNGGSSVNNLSSFLQKEIVQDTIQLFYPPYHDFGLIKQNQLIIIHADKDYEAQERKKIEKENNRQRLISKWIEAGIDRIHHAAVFSINEYIDEIMLAERDDSIAQHVAIELSHWASLHSTAKLEIVYELKTYSNNSLYTWTMNVNNIPTAS